MAEYVEKDAAIKALQLVCLYDSGEQENATTAAMNFAFNHCKEKIAALPAADVAPVRHGRWLGHEYGFAWCSLCHERQEVDFAPHNYCPHCGAKMDEETPS